MSEFARRIESLEKTKPRIDFSSASEERRIISRAEYLERIKNAARIYEDTQLIPKIPPQKPILEDADDETEEDHEIGDEEKDNKTTVETTIDDKKNDPDTSNTESS